MNGTISTRGAPNRVPTTVAAAASVPPRERQ